MKAFVYHGPGLKAIEDRPKPEIQAPGDAIVRIVKTTICGTDLHILKGDVSTCAPGRILGHEGVGTIELHRVRCHLFPLGRSRSHILHLVLRQMRVLPGGACIHIARPEAGSSAMRSTAPRPSMSGIRMPTPAFTQFQKERTRRPSLC